MSALEATGLTAEQCQLAREARDARFDGRFFVAVLSTGIYCRPVCPAPLAEPANQRFHATAASAEAAGFRPCLRCRPERAPAVAADPDLAGRALAVIERSATAGTSVATLAADVGVSSRHLRRVLEARFGVGPQALLASHRLRVAKRLLDDTDAPITDVALAAGFGSVRAFNAAVARCWQRSPTALRRIARHRRCEDAPPVCMRLAARTPFAHTALAQFFALRAVPGLEHVDTDALRRRWRNASGAGSVRITFAERGVEVALEGRGTLPLLDLLARVRRLTDIDADSRRIDAALARDPLLAEGVRALPGRRVPGMWDPFEGAVRAILGQQVSVAAARTLTGRLLDLCGSGTDGLDVFPDPETVAAADLSAIGIPAARVRALKALAAACVSGAVDFAAPTAAWRAPLLALPGIGPWTVEYLCMRAGRDPDAFPAGDLILRTRLGSAGRLASERQVRERAERWRPWRAYAVLQLWAAQSAVRDSGDGRPKG